MGGGNTYPLLNAIFIFGGITSFLSSLLYLFLPDGTVIYFGGVPSPSTNTWVPIVAAGDILCAFLLFAAARSDSAEVKRLVVLSLGVYMIFHLGAFVRGHFFSGVPQPTHVLATYCAMGTLTLPIVLWWGFLHPPQEREKQKVKKK